MNQKVSQDVEKNIRQQFFQDKKIIEGVEQNILELKVPILAEDATVVPISVHTKIPQTSTTSSFHQKNYLAKIPNPHITTAPIPKT